MRSLEKVASPRKNLRRTRFWGGLALSPIAADAKALNVLDYGASPGGKLLATAPIPKAIDECSAKGGHTVVIPAGVFLMQTIFLRNGVGIHFEKGAVVLGDTWERPSCVT